MKRFLFRLTITTCSFALLSFHLGDYSALYAQETLACINRQDTESKSREARLNSIKSKVDTNSNNIQSQQKIVDDLRSQLNAGSKTPEEQKKSQDALEKLSLEITLEEDKLKKLKDERDVLLRLENNSSINTKLSEIEAQKKVIEDLEKEMGSSDTSALSENMSQEDAQKLKDSGSKSNDKLEELEARLSTENEKLKNLEKELTEDSKNTQVQQKVSEIEAQEKVIEAKQEEMDEKTKEIEKYETSGKTSGDSKQTLTTKLSEEEKKLEKLQEEKKSIEKDFAKQKKNIALEEQLTSSNLSDFQLYEAAMGEVLIQDKELANNKELNFEALGLALNNMEMMSTAASALNHLECEPYGEFESKSYHLFVGAAATYVVDQINRIRNFKKASECQVDMSQFDTTTEGMQVDTLQKVYEQYSILADAVQKRFEGRKDTMALFEEALVAATEEYEEKTKKVGTARKNYEEGKAWVTKTAIKFAVTMAAAIIAYYSFFGIIAAIALFALAAVFAADLVKAVIYRDLWYDNLLKARNYTRLTCNYNEASNYEPLKGETPDSLKTDSEFPKFMEMKKNFWEKQSYDASKSLNMDQDVLDLEKVEESKRTGFPLVETRYTYIQAFMNGILDSNLLNEFMKAYNLTRQNEDQIWNLYSQAQTELQSTVTLERGYKTEKKFVTKTCLKSGDKGKASPDLKCNCRETKSCKQFKFPTFKNLDGQLAPPNPSMVKAINFSLNGDTEKARVEKDNLQKNAAALRKKLESKKANINKIRKEQNKRTKPIQEHANKLLTSMRQGPLSYRQKAESQRRSSGLIGLKDEKEKKEEKDARGSGGIGKIDSPSPKGPSPKRKPKKQKPGLSFALEGFVDSDEDLEDAEIDKTLLKGGKKKEQTSRSVSSSPQKRKKVKEVNRESELSLFKIISRRYLKSGYPRLLKKKGQKD
ncbi:MAG: hypothetical protein CME68_07000 [Halobacteriovoraceae bacterium]|nr:hypothetical protein [Halobacteriovoraceae bacterium]